MPRKARIDAPGAVHHIMVRGIERRKIFRNDADRDDFVSRLDLILTETQTPCYAQSFNRRHRRHGHLFQNRYKSILCQEESYLLELVRYIHLNPMRAGVVADLRQLNTYRYCGHGVLLGRRQMGIQKTDAVLSRFARSVKEARIRYREFVKKGLSQGKRPELSGGGLVRSAGGWEAVKMLRKSKLFQKADERILGDGDFVDSVLSRINERLEHTHRLRAQGYNLSQIVQRVAVLLDIPVEEVKSTGKRRAIVKARSIVCYWAHIELGMSQTELAGEFGVSQPAICAAVQKGQKIVKENRFELFDDAKL